MIIFNYSTRENSKQNPIEQSLSEDDECGEEETQGEDVTDDIQKCTKSEVCLIWLKTSDVKSFIRFTKIIFHE